jgi:hypothetical protein
MTNESSPAVPDATTATPSQAASTSSNAQVVKNALEVGGKMLIGLAGLCYVLGLIVVTIHLRAYGLNSLSLSQLHYVTAGVWVLLPILVMLFFAVFAKFVIDAQKDRWENKSKLNKLTEIVSALLGAIFVFYVALEYLGRPFGIQISLISWVLIPAFGTLSLSMLSAAVIMLMSSAADRPPLGVSLAIGILGILMFMAYVVLFAGHTYREIPWGTGGARPSQVELVIATDAKPYLESAGIKFSEGQNRTESIKLVLATEKEYVVINAEGKAVSVPSDSVRSVLYEK